MAEPKRQLNSENNESKKVDMLSNLPDSLLCHILSFLPTKTSVATSILSRRWRHLWKDLYVLDFTYGFSYRDDDVDICMGEPRRPYDVSDYDEYRKKHKHFVAFIDTVLAHIRYQYWCGIIRVCQIRKFRLFHLIHGVNYRVPTRWVSEAIGPHLQEFYLRLNDSEFKVPCNLFTCNSLVSLTLNAPLCFDEAVIPSINLPSLKNLVLALVSFNNPLKKLLSGCPVLETFGLSAQYCFAGYEFCLPSSLKTLTLDGLYFGDEVEEFIIGLEKTEKTSCLEFLCLRLYHGSDSISLVGHFPNMLEVSLDVFPLDGSKSMLLSSICSTKNLVLSYATIECLLGAPRLDFPEFYRLVQLQISLQLFDSCFLMKLLHNCPVLRVLKIDITKLFIQEQLFLDPSESREYNWAQPASVPNCVLSHLEILELRHYSYLDKEEKFVAYILQNGKVLKAITIRSIDDQKKKDFFLIEFSTLQWGSNTCQLKFE